MLEASAAPTLSLEHTLLGLHHLPLVVGMDEVGRGALAGPVTVGAVAVGWGTNQPPAGLQDSKLLSAKRRAAMFPLIDSWALAWSVGHASADEIDSYGIIGGLRLAGHRALDKLASLCGPVHQVILDGSHDWLSGPGLPREMQPNAEKPCAVQADEMQPNASVAGHLALPVSVTTQVKADMTCASVAAASVMAKLSRDAIMDELSREYPHYQWDHNKGYGTAAHRAAIGSYGPSDFHRRTWKLT